MSDAVEAYVVNVTLAVFMSLNLFDTGLRLNRREAFEGLRNVRFVVLSLMWGYVLCPGLAYLLTRVVPLEQSYADGLILVAMAPGATFLPALVNKARGDLSYVAPFSLLTSVVTVAFMPFAVPVLAKGIPADAWTIGKPLLLFLMLPMLIGLAAQSVSPLIASRVAPFADHTLKLVAFFLLMLVFSTSLYARGFLASIGAFAIATQLLFYAMSSAASYWLSPGLSAGQKSVLSLGMSTRNLGAAFAPFLAIPRVDQKAMVMVTIAIPVQLIVASYAARQLARRAGHDCGQPEMIQPNTFK
jgi:bile acid:Na+ symporter, BASS family